MEQQVISFFNNLPEVLQESPALYITAVCFAAGFGWRKLPAKYFPDTLLYPFVYTVGFLIALANIQPVSRAFGMGGIYASISIAFYATGMMWLENKQRTLFGSEKPSEPLEYSPSKPSVTETTSKLEDLQTK